jgi:NADPH:quinone reductase-like Zn-dependent oxidoreductase
MRAVRIHEFGGPEKVEIEDVPRPSIGSKEALVHVRAASVNPVDWMIREHRFNPGGTDEVPLTLGQDFSGTIEEIADDSLTSLVPGQDVLGEAWGCFAEYVTVPVDDLAPKPSELDFDVAASIPMAALTAWGVVIDTAKAAPGMRFLIHGASGGVGSFAAQLARWRGATVIATASRPSFEFLESLGVEQVIDYENERFEDAIDGRVDVVVDPLGGNTQARSWGVLREGGLLINLVGELDRDAAREAGARGVIFEMSYDTEVLDRVAKLLAEGTLRPHVTHVLPLKKAGEALDLNQQGRSHGKVVLEVA